MKMPILSPLPILTKGKPFPTRIRIWLLEVRRWEILENWEFPLPDGKRIIIPKGFIFDGASIPRAFWNVLSPTGLLFIPAIIHDFAYRYDYLWVREEDGSIRKFQEKAGKRYWDQLFYQISGNVNGMKIINTPVWMIITAMGGVAWRNNRACQEAEIFPDDLPILFVEMPDYFQSV